jgi:hypothetical protein
VRADTELRRGAPRFFPDQGQRTAANLKSYSVLRNTQSRTMKLQYDRPQESGFILTRR